jgi:hypothetical protein
VPEMTHSVVLYRDKNHTLSETIAGELWLYSGGVDQHDRNVVLDGINAMALATFQSPLVFGQQDRLLTNWTNQHVE